MAASGLTWGGSGDLAIGVGRPETIDGGAGDVELLGQSDDVLQDGAGLDPLRGKAETGANGFLFGKAVRSVYGTSEGVEEAPLQRYKSPVECKRPMRALR